MYTVVAVKLAAVAAVAVAGLLVTDWVYRLAG